MAFLCDLFLAVDNLNPDGLNSKKVYKRVNWTQFSRLGDSTLL